MRRAGQRIQSRQACDGDRPRAARCGGCAVGRDSATDDRLRAVQRVLDRPLRFAFARRDDRAAAQRTRDLQRRLRRRRRRRIDRSSRSRRRRKRSVDRLGCAAVRLGGADRRLRRGARSHARGGRLRRTNARSGRARASIRWRLRNGRRRATCWRFCASASATSGSTGCANVSSRSRHAAARRSIGRPTTTRRCTWQEARSTSRRRAASSVSRRRSISTRVAPHVRLHSVASRAEVSERQLFETAVE